MIRYWPYYGCDSHNVPAKADRPSHCKACSSPIHSGKVPCMGFLSSCNCLRLVRLRIASGMVPVIMFLPADGTHGQHNGANLMLVAGTVAVSGTGTTAHMR